MENERHKERSNDANAARLPASRGWPPARLFVIPLLIVIALVAVWSKVRLPSYRDADPRQLARDIAQLDESSWLKAYALSRMLAETSNSNLTTDRALCQQLCALLQAELNRPDPSAERVRLRVFMCRAIGEFRLPDGLPILTAAASERSGAAMDVRYAALEAIAVRADRLGARAVRCSPGMLNTVLQASRAARTGADSHAEDELRSTAAYTLGVLGGAPACDRLARMLDDAYPNARFNAATGLARNGDDRAVPVLLEMLAPTSTTVIQGESDPTSQRRKRTLVVTNAIRAAVQLATRNRTDDLSSLRAALARLQRSDQLSRRLRAVAGAAMVQLDRRGCRPTGGVTPTM